MTQPTPETTQPAPSHPDDLMIRLESVIIALLGSVLGVLLGLLFGFALQRSLADQGLTALAIPWAQLAAFLVLASYAGPPTGS